MEHDAWFFVGVLVFIFLVWIVTGGPMHSLSFSGPTLAGPGPLGGGSYLSLPSAPYTIGGGTNVSLPGSSNGGGSVQESAGVNQTTTFVGGVSFGDRSPYSGIVSMNHYVSGAGSPNPANEYIEIDVAQSAQTPVDLTGWTLTSSATGNASIIPKGTELPTSGIVNAAQDIVLTPGQRALVISGQSPIGASFRENKCIGYFSTFQTFSPALPQNCPAPSSELASFYGGDYIRDASCIDYVNTLSRCQTALTPPAGASSACQALVVTYFNYNGCVTAHQNDTDFAGNTWRIYLGRSNSMWRQTHEVVKLLDATGKTVDAFTY